MKVYNGIELLQAIKDGEIKSGTNIEVHDLSVLDKLVTTIHINSDRGLVWKTGEFDTSFLLNDYYYFKITDIDIQSIEEVDEEEAYTNIDLTTRWTRAEDILVKKLNEAIRAIKQLDRQINNK